MNDQGYELNQSVSECALDLRTRICDPIRVVNPNIDRILTPKMNLIDKEVTTQSTEKVEAMHRSYHNNAGHRMKSIEQEFENLGSPCNLIVMIFCDKFFPFFENWVASCDSNGIEVRSRLIAFPLDSEARRKCARLGVSHVFLDPEHYVRTGSSDYFGDQNFKETVYYKNAVIVDVLKLPANVLFQDVDLIWFRDPFLYLDKMTDEFDIQIMYDGPNRHYAPLYANTGFIYISNTDEARAVFQTALYNSSSIFDVGSDQFPLNRIFSHFIGHNVLRLKVLPERQFLNGHLFSLQEGATERAGKWRDDGVVLHYSWTTDYAEKVEKIMKFGFEYR